MENQLTDEKKQQIEQFVNDNYEEIKNFFSLLSLFVSASIAVNNKMKGERKVDASVISFTAEPMEERTWHEPKEGSRTGAWRKDCNLSTLKRTNKND